MFIEILFVTAQNCNQLRYPSLGKWLNKVWDTGEHAYHAILLSNKRNKTLTDTTNWKNFQ